MKKVKIYLSGTYDEYKEYLPYLKSIYKLKGDNCKFIFVTPHTLKSANGEDYKKFISESIKLMLSCDFVIALHSDSWAINIITSERYIAISSGMNIHYINSYKKKFH